MKKTRVHTLGALVGKMSWKETKLGPQLDLALEFEAERLDEVVQLFGGISSELLGVEIEPFDEEEDEPIATPPGQPLQAWKGVAYLRKRSIDPPHAKASLEVVETDSLHAGRIRSLVAQRIELERVRMRTVRISFQIWQEGLFDFSAEGDQ